LYNIGIKTVSSKEVLDKATPSLSKVAAVKCKKDDDELKRSLKRKKLSEKEKPNGKEQSGGKESLSGKGKLSGKENVKIIDLTQPACMCALAKYHVQIV
jgi:hypothetical protein